MLKRLAILAVLAAATVGLLKGQTAPLGTPKQGVTKSDSGQNGSNQPKPQDGKQSAPDPVPSPSQPTAPTCDEACQQGRQNLAIQGKLEWFTGLLVGVGFLQAGTMIWQAWLLRGTLGQIQVQAGHMKSQTKILEDSVAAAQKSADASEISAKAAMGIAIPTLAVYGFFFDTEGREHPLAFYEHPRVQLELKNYGQSPAFLKKFRLTFEWGSGQSDTMAYTFDPERVIDAGGTYAFGEYEFSILHGPPHEAAIELASGKQTLIFSCWVSYKDVFGSPIRKLEFSKHLAEFDPDPAKMLVVDSKTIKAYSDPEG